MSDWRASYRNWIRRYGLGPKSIMRGMWRQRREEELRLEEREEAARRATQAAFYARSGLLDRLGVGRGSFEFLTGAETLGEIPDSLRQIWAAIDALEKRTRDKEAA